MSGEQKWSTFSFLLFGTFLWILASTYILYTRNAQHETKISLLESEFKAHVQFLLDFGVKYRRFRTEYLLKAKSDLKNSMKSFRKLISTSVSIVKDQNEKFEEFIRNFVPQVEETMKGHFRKFEGKARSVNDAHAPNLLLMQGKLSAMRGKIAELKQQAFINLYCRTRGAFRDFNTDPIMILTTGKTANDKEYVNANQGKKCDVPCYYTGNSQVNHFKADGFLLMGNQQKKCPYQKAAHLTMENVPTSGFDIVMDTRLKSDVTAGYYSWVGRDFYKKPVAKTMPALASAFISNCGAASGRDQIIQELMMHGVSVDRYGRCFTPNPPLSESKAARIGRYKFHLAFENSITDDYVTEKYFESIEAGTIGVYLGAPNIQKYAPQDKAFLRVADFPNTKALAQEILRLANETAEYDSYLTWKDVGPSDSFKALIDISSVHSYCRLCIHMADKYMNEHGVNPTHATSILARERGSFWYRPVMLSEYTMVDLHAKIQAAFKNHIPIWANLRPGHVPNAPLKIYRITPPAWNMHESLFGQAYDSDDKVKELKPGDRIEITFV